MDDKRRPTFSDDDERAMRERREERRRQKEEEERLRAERAEKRKMHVGKLAVAAKIALAVVVVLSLLFVAAQSLGNVTFTKATDWIRQSVSNLKPGSGYPVMVGSGVVRDMQSVGDCVALLEDDCVLLLNSTAKEIAKYSHSYSKPVLSSASGRMLLCDKTTGRYFIADRSNELFSEELKTEVYCCTIGKNGLYAFSMRSDDSAGIVSVYGSDFKKLFDFKCASEYIIGLSVSPDGKFIAAIGIGASNAYSYSKLYIISVNEKKVISDFDFEGRTVNSVFYSGKNTVIVIEENSYSVITDNATKKDIDFGYNTISRFAPCSSGSFAVVLSKYGSIGSGTAAVLDSVGAEVFSKDIEAEIQCVDFDGKTLCIFDADGYISCFNSSGELIGRTKPDFNAQRIVVIGKYCYALCYGDLIRVNTKTDVEESPVNP